MFVPPTSKTHKIGLKCTSNIPMPIYTCVQCIIYLYISRTPNKYDQTIQCLMERSKSRFEVLFHFRYCKWAFVSFYTSKLYFITPTVCVCVYFYLSLPLWCVYVCLWLKGYLIVVSAPDSIHFLWLAPLPLLFSLCSFPKHFLRHHRVQIKQKTNLFSNLLFESQYHDKDKPLFATL